MKRKDPLDDLELYLDPTPLKKAEEKALSEYIKKLKGMQKKTHSKKAA